MEIYAAAAAAKQHKRKNCIAFAKNKVKERQNQK